jgi:hypothetical protein
LSKCFNFDTGTLLILLFDDSAPQFLFAKLKIALPPLMSGLTPITVVDPSNDNPAKTDSDKHEVVPKWGYGVIAGGSVAVVSASLVAFHAISKNRRQKAAQAESKLFNQQQVEVTPRSAEPVSRYSPRPGEKIL